MAEEVEKNPAVEESKTQSNMRYSIRTKLIAVISVVVIFIMISTAWLFMIQKKKELTHDIYVNSRSFAELTADDIVEAHGNYLAEGGFIQFNRVIQSLFRKTEDVSRITIITFGGEIIYDSETEKLQQHKGAARSVEYDETLLERIQAPFASAEIVETGRVVYLEKDPLGATFEVNLNGKKVEPIRDTDRISEIINPVAQKFAVLYGVSYDQLDARIAAALRQTALLLIFGILFAIGIATVIGAQLAKPIKALTSGVEEIAKGNFDHRVHVKTRDELGILSRAFNQMAVDLKKSRQALIYKERVMKELELAKEIQQSLVPKIIPAIPGLDIAASVEPAEEIGGDCYDFITVDEKNTLIYLGDVTGHGVPSGLLVSVANAMIFAFAKVNDIFRVMVRTNEILHAKSKPNMFITMAMLNWEATAQTMDFISAGHEKILHYSASEPNAQKKVTELQSGGIALGMLPDISKLLKKQPIIMNTGDIIILYSDGIPEAFQGEKNQYGMGRFRRVFLDAVESGKAAGGSSSETIRANIIADVKTFMGNTKQADDVTIMVIKRV